jgi:futalosine hydrolase
MKILLVAATKMELEPFLNIYDRGMRNTSTEILVTGIGIAATVYHLTQRLMQDKFDLVIQAGIAGSFKTKYKRGDVVLVGQDIFAGPAIDEGGNYKTIFQVGLAGENDHPYRNGFLINDNGILVSTHLPLVNAVTSDIITDKKNVNKRIKKKFNADIESMEGAAFHFVCLQQSVPFLQVRSISNKVGVRDKSKWNIAAALKNLSLELVTILDDVVNSENDTR